MATEQVPDGHRVVVTAGPDNVPTTVAGDQFRLVLLVTRDNFVTALTAPDTTTQDYLDLLLTIRDRALTVHAQRDNERPR